MACRLRLALLFLSLLAFPEAARAQDGANLRLRGFVTDAETGRPLSGVNVRLQPLGGEDPSPRGTAANEQGYYQIGRLAPGPYALRISFVGYRPYLDTLRLSEEITTRNAQLQPMGLEMEGVVVTADEPGAANLEAGLQTIEPEDLDRIPTPSASGDLAMYLQTLPGVTSLGDRGGGLYVRGGSPSQNLVLMDGIPIFRPFHILGFFSVFPQDLVQRVNFYAGGFPARYSGRISSVMDVRMRGGNNNSFVASAGASPLAASVQVEGPLRRDTSSFLLSARRSFIESVSPALLGEEQPLYFDEQFAKYERVFDLGRCSITGMHSSDRGKIDPERTAEFAWSNYGFGGRCGLASSSSAVFVDLSLGLSGAINSVGAEDEPERSSEVWRLVNNVDLTIPHDSGTEFRLGFQVGGLTWPSYDLQERFQGIRQEGGFYLTNRIYGGAELSLLDGRLSLNPSLGFYGFFRDLRAGPRLRASWRPWGSEGQELNAALTLHHQFLKGISDERDAGAVFNAWVPSPLGENRQSQALHALLGWKQQLGPFSLSAEGYYKRLRRLAVPIWSTRARFTTTIDEAGGRAYGLDTRVEFEREAFYGYVGYQWGRVRYALEDAQFGEAFGNPVQEYPPPHDRRHNLNVVGQTELPWFTVNARWQIGSGRPYTSPIGFDSFFDLRQSPNVEEDEGDTRFIFRRPNQARLPYYHRLDVNLERTFDWSAATLTAQVGAINSYDRRNLFYFDLFSFERIDQLPIIPFLSLKATLR